MTKSKELFNTPYGKQPPRCFFETTGVSMTQQQFAEESDIHNILRSHDRNQHLASIHRGNELYADFSNVTDFSDALELIQNAQTEFMNIPSNIREKFKNDAGEFYKYASNPDNHQGLVDLGLAKPQEASPPPSDAMPSETATPEAVEPQNSKAQE